jgi:hypothetical protein
VVSLDGEANRLHDMVCWVALLRGSERWRYIVNVVASFC